MKGKTETRQRHEYDMTRLQRYPVIRRDDRMYFHIPRDNKPTTSRHTFEPRAGEKEHEGDREVVIYGQEEC